MLTSGVAKGEVLGVKQPLLAVYGKFFNVFHAFFIFGRGFGVKNSPALAGTLMTFLCLIFFKVGHDQNQTPHPC